MPKRIIINPVTRISGFMEIEAIIENNKVVNARTKGFLFRGFEKMLNGRNPLDAVYFTQRICGICSAAHSTASALALEDAMDIVPTEQGRFLRDIIHGCEFLQNHIRHFYQFTIPDYVRFSDTYPVYASDHNDFRLPGNINNEIGTHYFDSLEISRSAHEMLAVLGGKAPHNHGIFIGGATMEADADKIIRLKSLLRTISNFINEKMIPDAFTLGRYYSDYFRIGGGNGNFLSYGCFSGYRDLGTLYINPAEYSNGNINTFDPGKITEETDYSWYKGKMNSYKPLETIPEDNMNKAEAYSWVKAARYGGKPYEVGPLARQWLSGGYNHGISAMDRTIARVLETGKIALIISELLENLVPGTNVQKEYSIPDTSEGKGLVDTTRGALGHWIKINKGLISFYQIITPSVWNFSSEGNNGLKGTAEQALIGTEIQVMERPVELGRIVRSFDPCISCATHVYINGDLVKTIQVMP